MRVLDSDIADIQGWLLRGTGLDKRPPIASSIENVRIGLNNACAKNTFDSLREHVLRYKGLWDGTPRLDTWLIDFMGADDTLLNRAIGKRWLVASVARALSPGCVADMMPILEGKQEIGKNYMLEIMFGIEYVSIPFGTRIGDKDFDQKAADSWCVHDDELSCTQRAGLEQVKSWLTQKTAKFRKAWDRDFQNVPRRFIVVGSTNKKNYLTDEENRRFWPINLRQLRAEKLINAREQIWSEAIAYHEINTEYRITKSDPLWEHLEAQHDERKTTDPVAEQVMHVIDAGLVKPPFTMSMLIQQMGWQTDKVDRVIYPITQALKALGFESRRVRRPGPDGRSVNAKFWNRIENGYEHISEHRETTSGPN
jgi:predicted P-loop ATPase